MCFPQMEKRYGSHCRLPIPCKFKNTRVAELQCFMLITECLIKGNAGSVNIGHIYGTQILQLKGYMCYRYQGIWLLEWDKEIMLITCVRRGTQPKPIYQLNWNAKYKVTVRILMMLLQIWCVLHSEKATRWRILMTFLQLWCVWHSEASTVHYSALVYILRHQLLCPGNHAIATLCPHSQRH